MGHQEVVASAERRLRSKILVVEDEMIVARDIQQQLELAGYESVGHARSAEQAIDLVHALRPNLVLMDIRLAGPMDGIAAAQVVRRRFALPVVFLTAFATDDLLERAKLSEPFGYILKPFSVLELRATLEMALYKHEADHQLRLSDIALRTISEGVVVTDGAQRIVSTNEAYRAITGYEKAELVGLNCRVLQGGLTDPRTVSAIDDALSAGARFDGEILNYRKDGSTFWNEMTIAPVLGDEGQVTHFVGVARDVNGRKRAEQENVRLQDQLQQAMKMQSIGRLAGGVAHDFNNMLAVILGHAEIALRSADAPPRMRADLKEIQRAGERAASLTRQLLAFARKQTIAPSALNLNEVVEGMLSMLPQLLGANVRVHWRPRIDPWSIKADPFQVDQLLTNLCVNARDAMFEFGDVFIATDHAVIDEAFCAEHPGAGVGDYVRLTVRDTGCGMSQEVLAQMFEPFFTTKAVGRGTGLGLSTVFGVVAQNGGFITVVSQVGAGATFHVYFPRHQTAIAAASVAVALPLNMHGRETILVVEDEPAILQLLGTILTGQGYSVLLADGPAAAVKLASEHTTPIQLLLSDVIMPTMNGRDLANLLGSQRQEMKRLFMSGYTADVIANRGVLDEGADFLQKPFSVQSLLTRVRAILDSSEEGTDAAG